MKFQTPVPVKKQSPQIDHTSEVVLMGSCFVEHIGSKFEHYQFRNATNPFGVIFNPFSITGLLERAVNQRFFTGADIFFANGRWHSYELHSRCSHPDRDFFLQDINQKVELLGRELRKASHVVFTLGTAWVYRHLESSKVVANCHKQPQHLFEKELLAIQEIVLQLERADHLVKSVNPACTIISTVSPVRHIKDGIVENQRSKAHLIAALHSFLEDTDQWRYFPSYEILMDELRDYRFYADDMLHPSSKAVEVVWSRFTDTWIAAEALPVMKKIDSVRNALLHRPFDPEGEAHLRFLENLKKDIETLRSAYPHMKFEE